MIDAQAPDAITDDLDSLLSEFADQPAMAAVPGTPVSQTGVGADMTMCSVPAEPGLPDTALAGRDAAEANEDAATAGPNPRTESGKRALSRRFRPPSRHVLPRLAAIAVLLATNGLSFLYGTHLRTAQPAPGAERSGNPVNAATAPLAQGVDRYVGLSSTSKIDGKTFLESEDVKRAIEELDGGLELHRELIARSKQFASDEPIHRTGSTIQVRSCNKRDCEGHGLRLDYDVRSKKVSICLTEPFAEAGTISYAFNQYGYREGSGCAGDPFPKAPARPSASE